MAQAAARDPAKVAEVAARHPVLTDTQIAYREKRQAWLSPRFEESWQLAADMNGKRLTLPADV